jgi:DNA-binding transcriptional MerR regulator
MKDLQIKKLYYSISEVSKIVGLEQYVLRYWETEFEQLRPQKNRAGNRIYTEKDIEIIKLIKKLTRENRYTIEGARQVMNTMIFENGVPTVSMPLPPEEGEINGVGVNGTQQHEGDGVKHTLKTIRASLALLRDKLNLGAES